MLAGPRSRSLGGDASWRYSPALPRTTAAAAPGSHTHLGDNLYPTSTPQLPQDADARPTPTGIREFVVGTGGYSLYDRVSQQRNSELWENRTWGVIKFTLKGGGYDWEFVPIDGQSFRDVGSASCASPAVSARDLAARR